MISNGGLTSDLTDGATDYLYSGVQCVEERDDENTALRQYVWGRYVDELIQQKELTGGTPTYYPLSDLLYRTVALTKTDKTIEEAYDTDAYGNTLIFSEDGADDTWFTDDDQATNAPKCHFIFTGRRYDPETQIYFYRARYYHPELGRFISRDPTGYPDGMNTYAYVECEPEANLDPLGTVRLPRWLCPVGADVDIRFAGGGLNVNVSGPAGISATVTAGLTSSSASLSTPLGNVSGEVGVGGVKVDAADSLTGLTGTLSLPALGEPTLTTNLTGKFRLLGGDLLAQAIAKICNKYLAGSGVAIGWKVSFGGAVAGGGGIAGEFGLYEFAICDTCEVCLYYFGEGGGVFGVVGSAGISGGGAVALNVHKPEDLTGPYQTVQGGGGLVIGGYGSVGRSMVDPADNSSFKNPLSPGQPTVGEGGASCSVGPGGGYGGSLTGGTGLIGCRSAK